MASTPNSTEDGSVIQGVTLTIGSALLNKVNAQFGVSTQTLSLAEITTVADVLEHIGLTQETVLLIILNENMVPRTDVQTQLLSVGDKLSLMPPIHAG